MIWLQQTSLPSSTSLFNQLNATAQSYLETKRNNVTPVQVEAQVPFWMVKNSDGYGNPSNMIMFLQHYYEWLSNFYGYENTNIFEITKLFDISETPSYLLPNFVKYYAPDIYDVFGLTGDKKPTSDAIRNTIANIKTEIYEAKSTETTFKRLMGTLFEIDPNTISIKYPKRKIMRLNGGLLEWMSNGSNPQSVSYFGGTGEYSDERYTLVGSYLNQGVLQDGNFWQEYSYVIDSSVDDSDPYYEEVVKKTLHPAGLVGFYEQTEVFSDISEGDIDESDDYEVPLVAHYYPYRLDSTATLSKCAGCSGELHRSGWDYPTFVFPSWDVQIDRKNITEFGKINVFDFFTLTSSAGNQSPNDIIGTLCDYACGSSGSAEFNWYIGQNEQYSNNVYIENQPIQEPESTRDEDLLNKYS